MITPEELIPLIKESGRFSTDRFDTVQLPHLINAAQQDLGIAGVIVPEELDAIIDQAITTYVLLNFGLLPDADAKRLKQSYDEQKAQLSTATGYTDWRDA